MEHQHDQTDDQQDVDEAGANVKGEKAKQPENNQNYGDESEHSFVFSRRGKEFRESCGSPSCDGRCPGVITQGNLRRVRGTSSIGIRHGGGTAKVGQCAILNSGDWEFSYVDFEQGDPKEK
jgi:hypothetical protein